MHDEVSEAMTMADQFRQTTARKRRYPVFSTRQTSNGWDLVKKEDVSARTFPVHHDPAPFRLFSCFSPTVQAQEEELFDEGGRDNKRVKLQEAGYLSAEATTEIRKTISSPNDRIEGLNIENDISKYTREDSATPIKIQEPTLFSNDITNGPIFQTGAKKPVNFSMSAMVKARALLDLEVDSALPSNQIQNGLRSSIFVTGSGKNVHLSAAGMAKAKALFEAERSLPPTILSQTDGGKQGKETAEEYALPTNGLVNKPLFQTGSGKPVKLSADGMAKARALLETETCLSPASTGKHTSATFPTIANMEKADTSHQKISVFTEHPQDRYESSYLSGFGKPVDVSVPLMSKTSSLLETGLGFPPLNIADQTPTFRTGNGEPVNLSIAGMTKARALFDIELGPILPLHGPPIMKMGSGKPVMLSEGIQRAKALLVSEPADDSCRDAITGIHASGTSKVKKGAEFLFKTATGHPVQISSSAMNKALALLKENDIHNNISGGDTGMLHKDEKLSSESSMKCGQPRCLLPNAPTDNGPLSLSRKHAIPEKLAFKHPRRLKFASPIAANCKLLHPSTFQPGNTRSQMHITSTKHETTLEDTFDCDFINLWYNKDFKPHHRMKLKAYFHKAEMYSGMKPQSVDEEIYCMNADTAKEYMLTVFSSSGNRKVTSIGCQDIRQMMLKAGATAASVTNEWVENHYRLIVWKLACYERKYPALAGGKFLTANNVIREMKYRYDKEVNSGCRSAFQRITERDASSAQPIVICISAVRDWGKYNISSGEREDISGALGSRFLIKPQLEDTVGALNGSCLDNEEEKSKLAAAKIEVTDGWYFLNAVLDTPLTKLLHDGKIFVGQKLRVCGARLCGCTEGLPPIEAFHMMTMRLHLNGTYRAHWADPLGFCRRGSIPLAFKCIKSEGGLVPSTYVVVKRMYPVLYKERLAEGNSITYSARAEEVAQRHFQDRQQRVIEETMLKLEETLTNISEECDETSEGAKLFYMLEIAADPELAMADMTSEQHAALIAYQGKLKATKQAMIETELQRALREAQLLSRDVTSFVRIRVAGVQAMSNGIWSSKTSCHFTQLKEGLIVLWGASIAQVKDIAEGGIYHVSALNPLPSKFYGDSSLLHLSSTRSTQWKRITGSVLERYRFAYAPRVALKLSELGKISLASEFDTAVLVLHVGEPYASGSRRKQWLFVADGSVEDGYSKDSLEHASLLAINFSVPSAGFLSIEHSFAGLVVGFCNLLKQWYDQTNSLWVADASDLCIYSSKLTSNGFLHLERSAAHIRAWAIHSSQMVKSLCHRVHNIISNGSKQPAKLLL